MALRLGALGATIVAATGCAVTNSAMNLGAGPPKVAIEADEFSPSIKANGPDVGLGGKIFPRGATGDHYSIRSWLNKSTGAATHQLYVVVRYGGDWHFYQRANDSNAQPLDFTPITRDVLTCTGGRCTYREDFGVGISDAALRRIAADSGYAVRVYARSGDTKTLSVPPSVARLQLATTDSLKGTLESGS